MPAKSSKTTSGGSKPARGSESPDIIEEPIRVIGDGASGKSKRGESREVGARKSSKKR